MMVNQREKFDKATIIYNIGKKDGITTLAVGKSRTNDWEIKKATVTKDMLLDKPELAAAIEESAQRNDWVAIEQNLSSAGSE